MAESLCRFYDVCYSCLSRDVFTWQICLFMLFSKIKSSRKFPNLLIFRMAINVLSSFLFCHSIRLVVAKTRLISCFVEKCQHCFKKVLNKGSTQWHTIALAN